MPGEDAAPLRLHAVVREPLAGRARRWLGSREEGADGEDDASAAGLDGTREVRHAGLSAVVSPDDPTGADGPEDADARLDRHARIVEALAGSGAVVPAPPGLRAAGEPAVRAFLDGARLALEEALDLFDGAGEVRLHVRRRVDSGEEEGADPPAGDPSTVAAGDPSPVAAEERGADPAVAEAVGLYRRLRRHARAARRLPPDGDDLLTAALLVPRGGWSEGTDLAKRWQEGRPGLEVEITGPWAPYDFVRVFPVEAPAGSEGRSVGGRPPGEEAT